MKKKTSIILISIVLIAMFLGHIYKKNTINSEEITEKEPFFIKTMALGQEQGKTVITKNTTVLGVSDITLSALTAGRVQSIHTHLGKTEKKDNLLVQLIDSQGTNTFRTQSAQLSIDSAKNNYEIQKQNLEKQITDLLLAQERTILSYTNSTGGDINTTILQLSGLQKTREKNRLDYENKVKSDETTITNNIATAKNVYTDTRNLLVDVIDQGDKILGVTPTNKNTIEEDIYIGGENVTVRNKAETQLKELFAKKDILEKKGDTITEENIQEYLEEYRSVLTAINDFTIIMKEVLVYSIEDMRYLPKTTLDGYTASFAGLQTKASSIGGAITVQINALSLFLSLYKEQQDSLRKQVEIAENTIIVQQTQLQEQAKNTELNMKLSSGNVFFAQNTKDLTLHTIKNSLAQAQLALKEATFALSKFSITTPIDGIIADVLVDVGQEVAMGTPIVKIVSESKEVEIMMTQEELQGVMGGDTVGLEQDTVLGTGEIISIGKVADKSGLYPVVVIIQEGDYAVGSSITVSLTSIRGYTVIPLNVVTIVDNGIGQIIVWDGKELIRKMVTLGILVGEYIEVKDSFSLGEEIVLSDVRLFDSNKMVITK